MYVSTWWLRCKTTRLVASQIIIKYADSRVSQRHAGQIDQVNDQSRGITQWFIIMQLYQTPPINDFSSRKQFILILGLSQRTMLLVASLWNMKKSACRETVHRHEWIGQMTDSSLSSKTSTRETRCFQLMVACILYIIMHEFKRAMILRVLNAGRL